MMQIADPLLSYGDRKKMENADVGDHEAEKSVLGIAGKVSACFFYHRAILISLIESVWIKKQRY